MENPPKEILVERRASIKWGDDLHTINLATTITVTDPATLQERVKQVISDLKERINDEPTWFGKTYTPPKPAEQPTPPPREAPKREAPPSKEPITIGRREYLNDLMKKSPELEDKIKEFLAKFKKEKVGDLTNAEAIETLNAVVGPRKKK
ncbi:MAG: hypothetical protein MUP55_00725 [Candidatus Aenigmarchaeota archaeon]|nr:hypothetical protein [Candidatus Aenigmarchaeota archaeon]